MPGVKNYIDPTTYDNPERAVSEFAKELDRNLIQFEAIIGGGTELNIMLCKKIIKSPPL
jgi:ephrin-A/ephrin-B